MIFTHDIHMAGLLECEDCGFWHPDGTCVREAGTEVDLKLRDHGRLRAFAFWGGAGEAVVAEKKSSALPLVTKGFGGPAVDVSSVALDRASDPPKIFTAAPVEKVLSLAAGAICGEDPASVLARKRSLRAAQMRRNRARKRGDL